MQCPSQITVNSLIVKLCHTSIFYFNVDLQVHVQERKGSTVSRIKHYKLKIISFIYFCHLILDKCVQDIRYCSSIEKALYQRVKFYSILKLVSFLFYTDLKSVALCNIVSTLGCITIQHTGRILFETANMVAAKTNKTRTAYGQAEPPGSPVKKLPLYKQLLSLDRDLAMICSVSADENSSLANLRPFLKLLEYSGHGIPWLLGVFVVMYLTNEKDPKLFQIAFNILFGKWN